VQVLPVLSRRQVAECRRCGRTLAGPAAGRVDAPLALSVAALLLLLPAFVAPLMAVSSFGARRESWFPSGVRALWADGFPSLATVVGAFSIVFPCLFLLLLIRVLAGLRFGVDGPLGRLFRWVSYLRPWMMIEVYLVGGFVAYSRLKAISTVEVGFGGWCLLAATLTLLLALTQLDDRTVWERIALRGKKAEGTNTIACTVCDLIVTDTAPGRRCPRCAATLQVRKPYSIQRTAALVAAGYLLYVPANILPVLTIVRLGHEEQNTIMLGVLELIHNQLWPLALIVFTASIVLPVLKLSGLTWMLFATWRRSRHLLVGRTRLYRLIDLIGRWSNIDVFMVSVLVAILRFGALTEVRAGDGLVAFAAVVIITMFATIVFDTRLMWDASRRGHARVV
jgi:paraquat-inducible protein A